MKIILLSGGSGKRLWPLSNNARSKQFLPVLESPDGRPESMVQRVLRQIREAGLEENITIATNASQKDIIINQLGDGIDIVAEPERRDTFPAIALACEHLSKDLGCPADETVIVMPCDPYTTEGYFKVIGAMADAVEADAAELVLMGITPTYPSPKYGYIVPEASDKGKAVMKVRRFTEKPSIEKAGELLEEGALWNGGVFAFKLGYLTAIAEKYLKKESFIEYSRNYGAFPKISFDYEVAEKARSVAVLPFTGEWKDLGTWNTLSEELNHCTIGNVVLGKLNSNTHVVNELGIPIFCDGLKDIVVAGSPDGILVCAKKNSETLKDYVDKFEHRPMYEERRWGTYRVIDRAEYPGSFKTLTKSLTIKAGKSISYQVHHHRDEVWTIVNGEGFLALDGNLRKVGRGEVIHIKAEQFHAIKALEDLTLIEVQMGDMLVEEDIDRYPWEWAE